MKKLPERTTAVRGFLAAGLMLVGADAGLANLSINFEAEEGYFTGCPIEQRTGWRSIPGGIGMVTQEASFNGGQSLKIEPSRPNQLGEPAWEITYQSDGLPQSGVRFIEFGVKLVPAARRKISEYRNGNAFLDLWGASLILDLDVNGNLQLVTGGTAESNIDPVLIQATEDGDLNRWLYLVIRQDLDTGTWDLYVDGALEVTDVPLLPGEDRNGFAIFSNKIEATYIDGIRISIENPFSLNEKQSYLTKAREVSDQVSFKRTDGAIGQNQGKGETANAGAQSAEKPVGFSSQAREAASETLYVDNIIGDNANSGMFSHAFGRNGPKASIKAAMAAAQSGAVIVVLPGTGIYEEGSRSAEGKKLTIRTVTPIIIK